VGNNPEGQIKDRWDGWGRGGWKVACANWGPEGNWRMYPGTIKGARGERGWCGDFLMAKKPRVGASNQAGKVMMAKARVGRCQPSCWSEGPGNGQNGGTHREREARAAEECKSKDGAANRCNNNPPKHGIGGGCWDF